MHDKIIRAFFLHEKVFTVKIITKHIIVKIMHCSSHSESNVYRVSYVWVCVLIGNFSRYLLPLFQAPTKIVFYILFTIFCLLLFPSFSLFSGLNATALLCLRVALIMYEHCVVSIFGVPYRDGRDDRV